MNISTFSVSILCLALLLVPARAAEKAVDMTFCGAATRTTLSETVESGIRLTEFRGMMVSSGGEKHPLHGASGQCWILTDFDPAKGSHVSSDGYCLVIDNGGDSLVLASRRQADGKTAYEIERGTGKWAGVTGKATVQSASVSKPRNRGRYELCSKIVGTYHTAK